MATTRDGCSQHVIFTVNKTNRFNILSSTIGIILRKAQVCVIVYSRDTQNSHHPLHMDPRITQNILRCTSGFRFKYILFVVVGTTNIRCELYRSF